MIDALVERILEHYRRTERLPEALDVTPEEYRAFVEEAARISLRADEPAPVYLLGVPVRVLCDGITFSASGGGCRAVGWFLGDGR